MQFSVKSNTLPKSRVQGLVLGCFDDFKLSSMGRDIDAQSAGRLAKLLKRDDFSGKAGQTLILHDLEGTNLDRCFILGLGKRGELDADRLIIAANAIASTTKSLPIKKLMISLDDVIAFHLHPKDISGAIVSIDQMIPPESWRWAGPEWQHNSAKNVATIVAAELQSSNPYAMASRWAEVLGKSLSVVGESYVLTFDDGILRFVLDINGRGDGVSGIDFSTGNLPKVLANAKQLGLPIDGNKVTICGTDFRFIA